MTNPSMFNRLVSGIAVFMLAWLLLAARAALADEPTLYFVPLPDGALFNKFDEIHSNATTPLISIFSMVVVTTGTRIYWDHWEQGGYQANIFNPGDACTGGPPFANHCTQIWGDENTANGCAPIIHKRGSAAGAIQNPCLVATDDLLGRGDVAITNVRVPIPPVETDACALNIGANPSAQGYCYNGDDKIGATFPVVSQRFAYPSSPGSLFAGATEVEGHLGFAAVGDSFVVPVGQSTASNNMFQNTSLWLMAGEAGATVTSSVITCNLSLPAVLPEGGWLRCDNANAGDLINITAGSAQAHLITAQNGVTYEMRWYQLTPRSEWSTEYVAPVGTGRACTAVWLYNDNNSAINVDFALGGASPSVINIPAHGVVKSPDITVGHGAIFKATSEFDALSTTDCNGGLTYDWGYPLIPADELTTQVMAGFARGCTNDCSDTSGDEPNSRSPVWITPLASTNIYVDYDGAGAYCDATDTVQGDVAVIPANEGDSIQIVDNQTPCSHTSPTAGPTGSNGRQCDNDMTGARIFTCNGARIAAAWGQNPERSGSSDDDGLDLGTVIFPLGAGELVCNSMIADAEESPFPSFVPIDGDSDVRTVTYTINLQNTSPPVAGSPAWPKADISLTDSFSLGGALVEDPDQSPLRPPPAEYRPSCLGTLSGLDPISGDTGGDGIMSPGESWVYKCYVRVKAGSPAGDLITNTVLGTASTADGSIEDVTNLCEATIRLYDPDLAMLSDFRAYATGGGVVVEWETGIEAGTLGFHLEREDATGEFERLNAGMLPAVLRGQSGVYRYRDGGASADVELTYRLLEVQNDGSTRTIGAFSVTPEARAPGRPRAATKLRGAAAAASAPGFERAVRQPSEKARRRAERAREARAALKARRKNQPLRARGIWSGGNARGEEARQ